jgi:hypothetical protein
VYSFLAELKALCAKYGITSGDPALWSLDTMISGMREVKATDDASITAFQSALESAEAEAAQAEGVAVEAAPAKP